MKGLKSIFVIVSLFSSAASYSQVNWPFPNQSEQGRVTGSIGEYRIANRFHLGVDVTSKDQRDVSVKAINSGRVTYHNNEDRS